MFKATSVQVYLCNIPYLDENGNTAYRDDEYYGNIAINDNFIIQFHGDADQSSYSFPASDDAFWSTKEDQDSARQDYDLDDIVKAIESNGLENNRGWMEDNAEKM